MGKWQRIPFEEAIKDDTRFATKIKTEDYLSQGQYQIIDQGKDYLGGYSNNPKGIYNDVPAIVFGDHTRVLKFVETPLFIGADGVKLLKVKRNDLHSKFVYYYLKSCRIIDTGYNRHYKWLKELNIPQPPLPIQQKIADALDKATALIEMRKAQIEKLDLLIKSQFIEMFGDPKWNTKKWRTVDLDEVIDFIEAGWSANGDARIREQDEYGVLKVSAVTSGEFNENEYKVVNEEIKKLVYPHKGDLLFSRANTRELVGATCFINKDYPLLLLPDKIWRVRFKSIVTGYYMKYLLSTKSIRESFSADSTGTSGSMFNISMAKFRSTSIPIPPVKLQTEFSEFVIQILGQKELLLQSLDLLEIDYRSLMHKCFSGEIY